MNTSTLLILTGFIGLVLRHLFMPSVEAIDWEDWLVVCTAVATMGYILVDYRRARTVEIETADIYHRIGLLEGRSGTEALIETRVADLQTEVTILRLMVDQWEDVPNETEEL